MLAQTSNSARQESEKFSILLIDDEPDILSIFKKSLEIAGHSTYGFMNPTAALAHFKENPTQYRVVVSDVRMPGMSGFELAREIRKLNPDIKIVLTSSFEISMKEFKTVMPSLKINGILEKPVTLDKLNDIINDVAE
jgi:CheY-like chemotaxis protein